MIEFEVTWKENESSDDWFPHTATFPTELRAKNRANEVMTQGAENVAVWLVSRTRIA